MDHRTPSSPHRRSGDGAGVVLFAAGVAVLVGSVAVFSTIRVSGWEQASAIPRWYVGFVGVYLTWSSLPLYVAHGYTRREFATQSPAILAAITTTVALLMTVGYVVEAAVYRVADWPQTLLRAHLFDSPDQLALVFVEFWLALGVWGLAGAMLGAGFYRNNGTLGLLLLPVALILVGLMEYTVSDGLGAVPFGFVQAALRPLAALNTGSLVTATAIWACVIGTGGAMTWALIRDMPLRNAKL